MADGSWNPTKFVRFEERIGTSTRPARILTDAGPAFLKSASNPLGPDALVREYLGTSLAQWLGLDVFEFGLMRLLADDEIPLEGGGFAVPGTAFVTRFVNGHTWSGEGKALAGVENPDTIVGLVALDTWTLNADRHPPHGRTRKPNPDNLFFSAEGLQLGGFRLVAFDHTECFGGTGRELSKEIAGIARIKDPEVYGLFPEFKSHITIAGLKAAELRFASFERSIIEDLVRSVPSDWGITRDVGSALSEFVFQRARYLSETLERSVSEACGRLAV